MSNEEIKQRIHYLVEHGGLYDDPIEDVRRTARWAYVFAAVACLVGIVELALVVLR